MGAVGRLEWPASPYMPAAREIFTAGSAGLLCLATAGRSPPVLQARAVRAGDRAPAAVATATPRAGPSLSPGSQSSKSAGSAARDPRPGPGSDRPHIDNYTTGPLGPQLQNPAGVALKACDVPSKNHNPCGLSRPHQRGAGTPNALEPRRGLSRSARCARASRAPPGSNPCGVAASRGGRADRWRS